MFSAFQHNMAQNNAYQIMSGGTPIRPAGGRTNEYEIGKQKWLASEIKRLKEEVDNTEKELETKNKQISALELKRLSDLADQMMQAELLALMMEAKKLEDQKMFLLDLLAKFMREEDDLFVILSCLPFIN